VKLKYARHLQARNGIICGPFAGKMKGGFETRPKNSQQAGRETLSDKAIGRKSVLRRETPCTGITYKETTRRSDGKKGAFDCVLSGGNDTLLVAEI
jgi:hypothetical protein